MLWKQKSIQLLRSLINFPSTFSLTEKVKKNYFSKKHNENEAEQIK